MCTPRYFGVDYVINPWMRGHVGRIDHELAWDQWMNLVENVAREATISLISPEPSLPDMVFTANAGVVIAGDVVVSRFRDEERRAEEQIFRHWFEQTDLAVKFWPNEVPFEGAGDALLDRGQDLLWVGHGFRTGPAAPKILEDIFGRRTVGLALVDPRFYHLDTAFCPLEGGWLMYYPPVFDCSSRERIAALVPLEKRILVDEEDALLFACNAVEVNGRVFVNHASDSLRGRMAAAGFEVIATPLSEFIKAGGGAKCLTLKLREK